MNKSLFGGALDTRMLLMISTFNTHKPAFAQRAPNRSEAFQGPLSRAGIAGGPAIMTNDAPSESVSAG